MNKLYRILQHLIYIVLSPFLLFHIFLYLISSNRKLIDTDIYEMNRRHKPIMKKYLITSLIYYLFSSSYYRSLFYHRLGLSGYLIKWYLPGNKLFLLRRECKIGPYAFVLNHPYATVINAKSVGTHFTCRHLTTIGTKTDKDGNEIPTIGNNVTLGAAVTIIGNVTIGDNVIIGAGTVIVKNVPDNTIVVGNPARIIEQDGVKKNILL